MALLTYSTGTVAVDTAGAVTVTGGIWSGTNVVAGDMISVDGGAAILLGDVSDVTHGKIAGWTGGAVSGKTYVAYQCSSLRFDDVTIAQDLQKQVAALNTSGYFVFVPSIATVPDPSLGDDGQYAFQPSTGKWWAKSGGLWGVIGSPYGLQPAANLSELTDPATARTNLGATTVGASLFTAADAAAVRDLASVFGVVRVQTFSVSGTYTPHSKMLYCIIECVGGGGAGGGVSCTTATTGLGGGGGGSGGYSRTLTDRATIGTSKIVTIGAGGAAQNGANGFAGGDTSVGALCIGKGGTGGTLNSAGVGGVFYGQGGAGAASGTGGVAQSGAPGGRGDAYSSITGLIACKSGGGGSSSLTGGGGGEIFTGFTATAGADGSVGAGGSGAACMGNVAAQAGGAGGSGIVIITEFCSN